MAGQDVSHPNREAGSLLPDLLVLAGLVAGLGLFLFLALRHSPDSPSPAAQEAQTLAEGTPRTVLPTATALHQEAPSPKFQQAAFTAPAITPPLPKQVLTHVTVGPLKSVDPPEVKNPSLPAFPIKTVEIQIPKRQHLTEPELVAYLKNVPFVGLDQRQADLALRAVGSSEPIDKGLRGPEKSVLALLDESTIHGLPFAESQDCQLEKPKALALDTFSRLLNDQITLTENSLGRHPDSRILSDRDQALVHALKTGRKWQTEEAVPALVQIMQVDRLPVRLQIVEMLAGFGTPEATQGLLNRAVFDIAPEVRLAANTALKRLYHPGYRQQLLDGLRYPWADVSWNASEALVAVSDQDAVPELTSLLSAPDPFLPFPDKSGRMVRKELVGIRHMQNCLLCHAPSRLRTDLVRGRAGTLIKSAGPTVLGGGFRTSMSGGYYKETTETVVALPGRLANDLTTIDIMVRADVTYLRQDFSVVFVADRAQFPNRAQRVDYLVRTREATPEEIAAAQNHPAETSAPYPQRDAVRYALQKLTGKSVITASND